MTGTARILRAGLLPVVLLVGLLSAGRGEAQTFRVVAFGDSVTFAFPFDFGTGSSCKSGSPDSCGLVARLGSSSYYGCNGSDCSFSNRGKSGERTSSGLSRIDQVLREREWDLLILMEGTNDIASGISPQTVEFNLSQMAEKARRQGVAVAHSSIIWFHPSIEKSQTKTQNNQARSLRTLISREASAEQRCFVDSWSRLCAENSQQTTCFANNYWTPPAGTIDHVGHPNKRGYDLLTNEFYRVLGASGEPGAAEPTAPTGEACGEKLVLAWDKETKARSGCSNWYRVQVDGPGGTKYDDWLHQDDVCSSSDCEAALSLRLRKGNHSFRVLTRNTAGYGPWSADQSFSVVPAAPDEITELLAPAGGIYAAGGASPEFMWEPEGATDGYRLEVTSPSGGVVIDEVFSGEEECNKQRCTFVPKAALPTGRYTWRVRSENICGGTWSQPALFEVFDSAPTVAPKIFSPSARTFDSSPVLRWEPVPGATEYEVQDPLGTLVTFAAADVCAGDTCRYLAPLLAPGGHTWRVRAKNPLGDGVWSDTVSFEVAACNCIEGRAAGGSSYLIAVPEPWNGELVIWAHGSNPFGVRETEPFGRLAQRQFDEGYALATTSFTVSGWPLFRSERDLAKLFSIFTSRVGRPESVYLAGESVGALAVAQALEKAKLGNLVGALTMCGPLAGARNWEGALDLRLAYDAVCEGVPGAEIPGGAKGLSNNSPLTPVDVASAVGFCTGIDKKKPDRTNPEKQRLSDLLELTGVTEAGLQEAMGLATFGLSDLVRDKKKLKGKVPVGNEGVIYGEPELDVEIERVKADAGAARKLESLDLSGKTREARIVSLHTSLDPVFFVENEREYADLVEPEALLLGLVEESAATHCGFTEAEEVAAWKTLTTWATGGKQPQGKNLQRRCKQLQSTTEGACRFDARPKIDPLDTRIPSRP